MVTILKPEYRPTEEDYLNITLLSQGALSEPSVEGVPMNVYSEKLRMHCFLVAMYKVRPDLVDWLVGPDKQPKPYFTRDERDFARSLLGDYQRWIDKNSQSGT